MQEQQLSDLESAALARIEAARSPQDLEAVRIEVLGRKGSLTQIGKDMGKLAPEGVARIGKQLNAAKQKLESASESRQRQFDAETLEARLNAEWLDLKLPAPRPPPPPRYNPKSKISSPPSVSPFSTAPRSKTNITISTRSTSPPTIPRATCRTPSGSPMATCCAPTLRRCRCAAWSASDHPCA